MNQVPGKTENAYLKQKLTQQKSTDQEALRIAGTVSGLSGISQLTPQSSYQNKYQPSNMPRVV
jgi:hypothetical protein